MENQFWYCNVCQAQNHISDGECQVCECGGSVARRIASGIIVRILTKMGLFLVMSEKWYENAPSVHALVASVDTLEEAKRIRQEHADTSDGSTFYHIHLCLFCDD